MKFSKELLHRLKELYPKEVLRIDENDFMPYAEVEPKSILDIIMTLRKSPEFLMDYLVCISGTHIVDENNTPLGFEIVYHLYSYETRKAICVKAFVKEDNPKIMSIDSVYGSANWYEREIYGLLGIVFEGSKDMRRILLPPDWVGHPLRKDYVQEDEYDGISTKREDELRKFKPTIDI